MKRLIPDTIAVRTLLVLVIGLMVSHALSIAFYLGDRQTALMLTGGEHVAERIATVLRLVERSSEAERRRIVALADAPAFHVALSQGAAIDERQEGGWQAAMLRDAMTARLNGAGNPVFRLRYADSVTTGPSEEQLQQYQGPMLGKMLMVSLQLPDKSWLNFATAVEPQLQFLSLRLALSMAVMLLAVGISSAWVVRNLTKPLVVFTRAAQRLGVDVKAPPIPENGPSEVRQAASAFNKMQDRIRRLLEDRTLMVAAISHDLGTPITRLRLRAEFMEDDEQRKRMLADLADMEKMVAAALSFARDEVVHEPAAMVDLRALIERVCDDLTDSGQSVALTVGDDAMPYRCVPVALRRALTNLVENAVKYGSRAHVSVESDDDQVVIRIDDEGPGIPDELQEEVFRPFRRLDISRDRDTGGTGLGMTVARSIVRAHGGDVTLLNREKAGLRVNVVLPR